jgi:glycogen debranching enzyme
MSEAGLGQISEILDGDEPHTPRGCIAQAWSVAELLRAAIEDVYVFEITPDKTNLKADSMRVVSVTVQRRERVRSGIMIEIKGVQLMDCRWR